MILLFILGFLALAAAMDRHRGSFSITRATVRARMLLRNGGWSALSAGTITCVTVHGWSSGLIRAAGLATPAAVIVLLAATYLRVPRRTPRDTGIGA